MTAVVARIPLILTLAPDVVVNTQDELKALISDSVKGLIEGAGEVSVGRGRNISAKNFVPVITNGQ